LLLIIFVTSEVNIFPVSDFGIILLKTICLGIAKFSKYFLRFDIMKSFFIVLLVTIKAAGVSPVISSSIITIAASDIYLI
jgi:hypothetical protein